MNIDARQIIGDAARAVFEDVESRCLMSAANVEGHVLSIEGTRGDDQINVSISDDGSEMYATVNGESTGALAAQSIYEIRVDSRAGDDHVYIDPRISANAIVTTGGGNDVVYTGRGNDNIDTGSGNDTIDAGAGNDTVYGGTGNDKINGGSGNDKINGGSGNDSISADGGADQLAGRRGNDKFYLDADDQLDAGNGRNQVTRAASLQIRNDGFVPPKIRSISIIDADTGAAVRGYEKLTSDTTLDPAALPARYTIIAEAEDGVKSVYFQTGDNSLFRRDNGREFTMTGQDETGKYAAWSPTAGKTYTLNVVANTATNLAGFAGETFSIKLTLKASGSTNGGGNGNTTGANIDPLAAKIKLNKLVDGAIAGQQFSIEATGTTVPNNGIEDAKFEWDFGDPTGRWNKLPGFNANHVYEKAGTYTVKLTVTAPGGHVSTATTTVKVEASSYKTIYVAANGNDKNDGTSQDAPVKTLVRAAQLIDDNTKVLLRRGDTFGVTTTTGIENKNVVISAYGSGASPVVRYEGARNSPTLFEVKPTAENVLIQGLTFTSIFDKDTNQTQMPHGIRTAGKLVTIRDNTFLHLGYAINNNGNPNGLFIFDNKAPVATALRAYFSWTQGKNIAIVGNTVANSTREHNVRISSATNILVAYNDLTNADRRSDGDDQDYSKGTITNQKSAYSYIANNELHGGAVGVGPLGGGDGYVHPESRTDHVVVEGNVIDGNQILVYHGANNTTIRDNEIRRENGPAIWAQGWSDEYNRGVTDLVIDHNVGINNGLSGSFFWVAEHVDGITLTDNVFVAPNLKPGGDGAAAVKVEESDLRSFRLIDGNVWPSAARGNSYANGGMFTVGKAGDGYYESHTQWNSRSQVGDDVLNDVAENNAWKITSSMLKKAA